MKHVLCTLHKQLSWSCIKTLYSAGAFCISILLRNISKMQFSFLLLLDLGLLCITINEAKYRVKDGNQLIEVLCNNKFTEDTVLLLNSSTPYNVNQSGFCSVKSISTASLTIKSAEEGVNVKVLCKSNPSSMGLVFNCTSITIQDITFNGCGAQFSSLDNRTRDYFEHSKVKFSDNLATTLLIINCSTKILRTTIIRYHGFALATFASKNIAFTQLHVSENCNKTKTSGSGILLLFAEINEDINLIVKNSTFKENFQCTQTDGNEKMCFKRLYHLKISSYSGYNISKLCAGAVTVIIDKCEFKRSINLLLEKLIIAKNIGTFAAGLLFIMTNSDANLSIINSTFDDNFNKYPCRGSSIVFYRGKTNQSSSTNTTLEPLTIEHTKIQNHNILRTHNAIENQPGAIYIGVEKPYNNLQISFKDCAFVNNSGDISGVCIFMIVYDEGEETRKGDVKMLLKDITATQNAQSVILNSPTNLGVFSFNKIDSILLNGVNTFTRNFGPVIKAFSSSIYLAGQATFEHNIAIAGTCFYIEEGYIYFKKNVQVNFNTNHATTKGGAIHAFNHIQMSVPKCVLQFTLLTKTPFINFTSNSAIFGGNIIFASPIFNCYLSEDAKKQTTSVEEYYKRLSIIGDINNDNLEISSKPEKLKICDKHELYSLPYYPGQTIKVNIAGLDGSKQYVNSLVTVSLALEEDKHFKKSKSSIRPLQTLTFLNESSRNKCTAVSATVKFFDNLTNHKNRLALVIGIIDLSHILKIPLNITKCPLGFYLNKGICNCKPTIHRLREKLEMPLMQCNTNELTINPPDFQVLWIGKTEVCNNSETLGISPDCPYEFCRNTQTFFYVPGSSSFYLRNVNNSLRLPICKYNRTGTLCGICQQGYSVVFGTRECSKCSNWNILTIFLYISIGPILIYLLYALKLTITTGTINGFLFYAQLSNTGLLQLLMIHSIDKQDCLAKFLVAFLSFLNLNLGFPMCFFNGMTELWKTVLSLAFPVYLLGIIILLIVVSDRSPRFSNATSHSLLQVMVTIVHLSLSKVLLTVADVFTPATIYTQNSECKVWYKNGELRFGSNQGHVILMIATTIVGGIIMVPYLVILFGGKLMLKFCSGNNYLRAIHEAIHGSYKETRKYWFSIRMLLLLIVYTIFVTVSDSSSITTITAPIIVAFSLIQAYFRPFKNKALNILDAFIMLNIVMTYSVTMYAYYTNANSFNTATFALTATIILVIFITFIIIVIYQFLFVTGVLQKLSEFLKPKFSLLIEQQKYKKPLVLSEISESFYDSCSDYREPILGQ